MVDEEEYLQSLLRCIAWLGVLLLAISVTGCTEDSPPTRSGAPTAAVAPTTKQYTDALTQRQVDNLAAFTRLLGYVRYFHPSVPAATVDWERFAIENVEAVIDASDAETLATRLNTLFSPYAPLLQVYPSKAGSPELPAALASAPEGASAVTFWVHMTVPSRAADERRQRLPGERVHIPLEDGQAPEKFVYRQPTFLGVDSATLPVPQPDEPYQAELGSGVSVQLPLALYSDGRRPLPRHDPPPPPEMTVTPSDSNRATRLATVALTWNAFQHLFTYWNVVDADWDKALHEALATALDDTVEGQRFYHALRRFTAIPRDAHTFTDHSAYGRQEVAFPGFTWDLVQEQLVVTTVEDDEIVQVGDIILEINGKPAEEVLAEQLEMVPPRGQLGVFIALWEQLTGEAGSTMTLTIQPADDRGVHEKSVTRDRITNVIYRREPRPPKVAHLAKGIFYVDLIRLLQEDVAGTVEVLADAEGIVFDMRGYPGGGWAPVELLGHLTEEPLQTAPFLKPIITRPDHTNIHFVEDRPVWVQPQEPRLTENVAFIINGNGTFSYAESILGIVAGYGLGERVGKATGGANGNLVRLPLPAGYGTSWTGLHVTKFDASPLFTVGITPTVKATRSLAGVASGRDELLEAAFEVVSGREPEVMSVTSVDLP